jgi:hypothetical protein
VTEPTSTSPRYRAEILFRDEKATLFLAQSVLPKAISENDFPVVAVGFTEDGRSLPPPDPGYAPRQPRLETVIRSGTSVAEAPPAEGTHLYRVSLDRAYARPGEVAVSIADRATAGPLPTKLGEPTFVLFWDGIYQAVFRVELVRADVAPLRKDRDHWQQRTRAIARELLARRDWINEDGHRLATAACVLRDPRLIEDLRDKLQAWIDAGEEEIKRTGFPHHLVDALVIVGDARDVSLLEQIAERPRQAYYLVWKVAPLARRIGVGPMRNLLLTLLNHRGLTSANDRLKRLRAQEPSVPEPACGDGMVLELARAFQLDPAEFGMVLAEQRLLAMADRFALSARDRDICETCVQYKSGTWIMPSLQSRKDGIEAMRRWIAGARETASPPRSRVVPIDGP